MKPERYFCLFIFLLVVSYCFSQYIPWNATPEREIRNIENWSINAKEAYDKQFYNYCAVCLESLDYCNKSRLNTQFSEDVNQMVKFYSDNIRSHLLSTYNTFNSDKEKPIYFARDAQGSFLILPGDIRINYSDIQLIIESNQAAIDFLKNRPAPDSIVFDITDKFIKVKLLNIKVPYQKGGQGFTRWGHKDYLLYEYCYNISTNSHTIVLFYLGEFTIEQLIKFNSIFQYALEKKF